MANSTSFYFTGKGTDDDPYVKNYREAMGVLYLRNERQRAIYENEVMGQLSDGAWENDDFNWDFWHRLKVKISSTELGFYAKGIPDRTTFSLYYNLYELKDRISLKAVLGEMGFNHEEIENIEHESYNNYKDLFVDYPELEGKIDLNRLAVGKIEAYYTEEMFRNDMNDIEQAMRTNLRKLEYIDDWDGSRLI